MEACGPSHQGRSWGCRPTSPCGPQRGHTFIDSASLGEERLACGDGAGSLETVGSLTFCWLVHIAGSSSPGPPLGEQ